MIYEAMGDRDLAPGNEAELRLHRLPCRSVHGDRVACELRSHGVYCPAGDGSRADAPGAVRAVDGVAGDQGRVDEVWFRPEAQDPRCCGSSGDSGVKPATRLTPAPERRSRARREIFSFCLL